MHDLSQEMAQRIVVDESKVPQNRSRHWNPDEICNILEANEVKFIDHFTNEIYVHDDDEDRFIYIYIFILIILMNQGTNAIEVIWLDMSKAREITGRT